MEFSKSQEKRIAIQKGLITSERLAEILRKSGLNLNNLPFQECIGAGELHIYILEIATELLKKCDIQEKE